ncbi:hypothetical protein BPOR_1384g00030 [Botrytis porri]|uniref:Uncharacterized protein n=1 Tax=Botrytis porri TaxID=87229 RepID=A0A4Z1KHW8_9HELO|nr:hypothetical protein BPOR_1384g00030 [Botrytis porri]
MQELSFIALLRKAAPSFLSPRWGFWPLQLYPSAQLYMQTNGKERIEVLNANVVTPGWRGAYNPTR